MQAGVARGLRKRNIENLLFDRRSDIVYSILSVLVIPENVIADYEGEMKTERI